jgi:hypothetical protein
MCIFVQEVNISTCKPCHAKIGCVLTKIASQTLTTLQLDLSCHASDLNINLDVIFWRW